MIQSVQRAAQILGVLGSGTPRPASPRSPIAWASPSLRFTGCCAPWRPTNSSPRTPRPANTASALACSSSATTYLDGSELRVRSLRWAESFAGAGRGGRVGGHGSPAAERSCCTMSSARTTPCRSLRSARPFPGTPARTATRSWRAFPASHRAAALAADLVPLTGRTKTTRPGTHPRARPGAVRSDYADRERWPPSATPRIAA